jgi:hypothetical protein
MKEKTVKWITTAAVAAPAAVFGAGSAVQSGVDETRCLQRTLEPCPATNLLVPEPDMPIKNSSGGSIPMQTVSNSSGAATVTLGRVVYWQT